MAAIRRIDAEARRRPGAPRTAALAPAAQHLADTFTLTARRPHAPGRGSLYVHRANIDARAEPEGEFQFLHNGPDEYPGGFALALASAPNLRLLIECTIAGQSAPINGRLYYLAAATPIWSGSVTPYENVVSFLTPPIPPGGPATIYFGVSASEPNAGMYGWLLYGCEVTRLNLP